MVNPQRPLRQCADCLHWVGHHCQVRDKSLFTPRRDDGPICPLFVRGSLQDLFRRPPVRLPQPSFS